MTGLTFDAPGEHLFVRSVGAEGIRVGDTHYQNALVLTPEVLIDDWPPQAFGELTSEHFEVLLALEPDLVLLGVGATQRFLHPERLAAFYRRNIGVEVMTTVAACRTFNVLASEGRRVVAGLLPLDAG